MTKEEIKKILDNTKVYVNGKSKEIQEKLFSFGYKWQITNSTEVSNIERPFLFIYSEEYISYTSDMCYFTEHENREISADEILSLEITEPSYRPFKDNKECWDEMNQHQPLGWIKSKVGNIYNIVGIFHKEININGCDCGYSELYENYMFMDGAPFGIKED